MKKVWIKKIYINAPNLKFKLKQSQSVEHQSDLTNVHFKDRQPFKQHLNGQRNESHVTLSSFRIEEVIPFSSAQLCHKKLRKWADSHAGSAHGLNLEDFFSLYFIVSYAFHKTQWRKNNITIQK